MKKVMQIFNYFFIGFSFLANKKLIAILTVALFIALLNVSTGYREELLLKEQDMIFEKKTPEIKYYNDTNNTNINEKTSAASKLVECLSQSIETDKLNNNIKEKINELYQFYNGNDEYFSFLYKDLYTGFTVSYNEDAPIFTASTIKAPAMIYLYEEASKKNVDLEEKLTYTSNFYSGGSGVLKNKEQNTEYTVKQLIEYAIHDSDNIAYAILINRFKRENILKFWQELGTKNIFTLNTIWGTTSAKDASIYMQELYRFYLEDEQYGTILMKQFQNADWKMITNRLGEYNTANKGGWSDNAIHDVAIVFEENPYLLVIMSNTGTSDYMTLFTKTSTLVGQLHEEYWKSKEEICSNIKQY